MQKTFTDALIRKLNRACQDLCAKGKCNMECEVFDARIGYCKAAWEAARQMKTR